MAGAAIQRRLSWLVAEAVEVFEETVNARSIVFEVPGWPGHRPGQHVDVRLTAPDGYQAQRSYSIAAPADQERVAITVELVSDGEVSPYLMRELRIGDRIELRGPIGGYFVWEPGGPDPIQLVAGGSGIVPLMAMMRARIQAGTDEHVRLLVSARSAEALIYREELQAMTAADGGIEVVTTLTRAQPAEWPGYTRRVDRAMLEEVMWPPHQMPISYVCGPTPFVEAVASSMVDLGHAPETIKTERFGPTGG